MTPAEVTLKICVAIRKADEEAAGAEPLRVAEILNRYLDESVEILCRHEPWELQDGDIREFCRGCGYDTDGGGRKPWPCPEVRSVAKSVGVNL